MERITVEQIKDAAKHLCNKFDSNAGRSIARRAGFLTGAQWMEQQLEPTITELEMKLIRSKTKWISVKERTPSEGNRYWCYIEELNDGGWWSNFQWNCYYDTQEKEWRDDGKTYNVTYWTDLLPPPL